MEINGTNLCAPLPQTAENICRFILFIKSNQKKSENKNRKEHEKYVPNNSQIRQAHKTKL